MLGSWLTYQRKVDFHVESFDPAAACVANFVLFLRRVVFVNCRSVVDCGSVLRIEVQMPMHSVNLRQPPKWPALKVA